MPWNPVKTVKPKCIAIATVQVPPQSGRFCQSLILGPGGQPPGPTLKIFFEGPLCPHLGARQQQKSQQKSLSTLSHSQLATCATTRNQGIWSTPWKKPQAQAEVQVETAKDTGQAASTAPSHALVGVLNLGRGLPLTACANFYVQWSKIQSILFYSKTEKQSFLEHPRLLPWPLFS
jgi:hypothetical protein